MSPANSIQLKRKFRQKAQTKWSNASDIGDSSNLSPKALKMSDEAIIEVLQRALLGFFIALIMTRITLSLIQKGSPLACSVSSYKQERN